MVSAMTEREIALTAALKTYEILSAEQREIAQREFLSQDDKFRLRELRMLINMCMAGENEMVMEMFKHNCEGDYRNYRQINATFEGNQFYLRVGQDYVVVALVWRDSANVDDFTRRDLVNFPNEKEKLVYYKSERFIPRESVERNNHFVEFMVLDSIKEFYKWRAGMRVYTMISGKFY